MSLLCVSGGHQAQLWDDDDVNEASVCGEGLRIETSLFYGSFKELVHPRYDRRSINIALTAFIVSFPTPSILEAGRINP